MNVSRSPWVTLLLFLFASQVFAADLTPSEQQALAKSLGAKAQRFEMWTDDDGHVTGLIFINHQALTKSVGEKPGIDDDDLLKLASFPKLTAVNLEAQPVGDRGLAVLKRFPGLKQVGFHYMAKHPRASATPDFVTMIDGTSDLEILEIKHNFRMDAINVDKLGGPFPKVWRLVVDTPLTAEQTLRLVKLCPNVTDLQLHRTSLSPEQLKQIVDGLPKLEVLWLKPRGPMKPGHLAALAGAKKLRILSPQGKPTALGWDAWQQVASLPSLERLELSDEYRRLNADPIERLRKERPDLVVDGELTRSRNYEGL